MKRALRNTTLRCAVLRAMQSLLLCGLALVFASCGRDEPQRPHAPNIIMNPAPPSPLSGVRARDGGSLNVIVILADDLGFTDIGAFGGEIPTPNLDKLADKGLRFTNLYAAPSCSPSRAMLMSGVNPHAAGVGAVPGVGIGAGKASYLGYLNPNVASLAELMQFAGYTTLMAGKWDLGATNETSPAARGFDRSFSLEQSAAGHFSDLTGLTKRHPRTSYRQDYSDIQALPDDFYSTTFYTDKLIEYIDQRQSKDAPFFAYLAYTAPHWPLQAPDEWIDKFEGAYDDGFAPVLKKRLERGVKLGVFSSSAAPDKLRRLERFWSALDEPGRKSASRRMQVYAAMVAKMDWEIGRLVDYLEKSGQAEDTVILFASDNGPDFSNTETLLPIRGWVKRHYDNSIENMGRPNSYVSYGSEWAQVSAGPFKLYKGTSGEGGVKTPGILYWPGFKPSSKTRIVRDFVSFTDILPTAIDIAGLSHPGYEDNSNVLAPEGRSFASLLTGTADPPLASHADEATPIIWESAGTIAVRKGDWKLLYAKQPVGDGKWRLFNIANDPFETTDLSKENATVKKELRGYWRAYADHYDVQDIPWYFRRILFSSRPKEFRRAASEAYR